MTNLERFREELPKISVYELPEMIVCDYCPARTFCEGEGSDIRGCVPTFVFWAQFEEEEAP
jgi:hypothetical protein